MVWVLRRLYRERRRAAVTFVLFFVSFVLLAPAHLDIRPGLSGILILLATSAIMSTGLAVLGAVYAILLPVLRTASESLAAVFLLEGARSFVSAAPAFEDMPRLLLLAFFALIWLYNAQTLDTVLKGGPARIRTRSVSRTLTPETLFPFLLPDPDRPETILDDLVACDWIEAGRVLRTVQRYGPVSHVIEEQTVLERDPPHRLRHSWNAIYARPDDPLCHGEMRFELLPYRGGVEMRKMRCPTHLPPRARLFGWVDDSFGKIDDAFLRKAEARAASL